MKLKVRDCKFAARRFLSKFSVEMRDAAAFCTLLGWLEAPWFTFLEWLFYFYINKLNTLRTYVISGCINRHEISSPERRKTATFIHLRRKSAWRHKKDCKGRMLRGFVSSLVILAGIWALASCGVPNANEQCKLIYDQNAVFCEAYKSNLCTQLVCRVSSNDTLCNNVTTVAAAEGTPCGPSQVCFYLDQLFKWLQLLIFCIIEPDLHQWWVCRSDRCPAWWGVSLWRWSHHSGYYRRLGLASSAAFVRRVFRLASTEWRIADSLLREGCRPQSLLPVMPW